MRFISNTTIALVALFLSSYATACNQYDPACTPVLDIISDAPAGVLANSPASRCLTQSCIYFIPTPLIRQQLIDTFISKHLSKGGKELPSTTLDPNTTICVVCNGGVLKYDYNRSDDSTEPKELTLAEVKEFGQHTLGSRKRLYRPESSEGWKARLTLGIVEEDWVSECENMFCAEEGNAAAEWTPEENIWLYTDPYAKYGHRESEL